MEWFTLNVMRTLEAGVRTSSSAQPDACALVLHPFLDDDGILLHVLQRSRVVDVQSELLARRECRGGKLQCEDCNLSTAAQSLRQMIQDGW